MHEQMLATFWVGGRGALPLLKIIPLSICENAFGSSNMDYPTQVTKTRNPLTYTFDGHFSPDTPDDDDDDDGDSSPRSSESESQYRPVTASFQLIANTMLRMELAQLEMMKKREIARQEAQRRHAELEHEMTRMMLQTQAQVASIVCHDTSTGRKRKSSTTVDHHSTTSTSGENNLPLPAFFNQLSFLLLNAVMEL